MNVYSFDHANELLLLRPGVVRVWNRVIGTMG